MAFINFYASDFWLSILRAHIVPALAAGAVGVRGAHRALGVSKSVILHHRLIQQVIDKCEDQAVDDRLRQEGRLRRKGQQDARGQDNEENSEEEGHREHHLGVSG